MKKWVIAGIATLAVVGTGLGVGAFAQGRFHKQTFEDRFEHLMQRAEYGERKGWRGRRAMNPEDRAAFLDARLAAVKAGLRLTAEQEKLWGPVESTVRDLGKKWGDRFAERRTEMQKRRAERRDNADRPLFDPVERIRTQADRLAERAGDMKRFADVAQPLYATLDENQKRRLHALVRGGRHGMNRWNHDDPRGSRGPESEDRR